MAGRGKARGGRTGARRGRLNKKEGTGSGKQPGDIKEEAPCQLCSKIYGEEDKLMQFEDYLLWSCIECLEITAQQYAFMMDNDHVKWYCSDCISNSRARSKTTNDDLMTMMETIRDSLSGLVSQIEKKAGKSVVEDLSLVVDNLGARATTLEKNDPFPPLPAQPQAPAEVQREVVAQAASELKEHNERKRNSIVFNVPETSSNLKTVCKKRRSWDDPWTVQTMWPFWEWWNCWRETFGQNNTEWKQTCSGHFQGRTVQGLSHDQLVQLEGYWCPIQNYGGAARPHTSWAGTRKKAGAGNEGTNPKWAGFFFYVVRGLPGNRKIVRVQKMVRPRDTKGEPKQQETSQMNIVGQGEVTAEKERDKKKQLHTCKYCKYCK